MKKQFPALALVVGILAPSMFADLQPLYAADYADKTDRENSTSPVKERAVAIPKAIAGVIAGLAIGVPVRISKDVRRETRRIADTLRADVGNDFGILENAFVLGGAVPFGLLGGTILGTIHGTEYALTYGSHQPFSKESLSLKEPAQEPDKQ